MEDKPESVVNAVVSNSIFDARAFSILSKLPIKSLMRFGCVCKSWSHLFVNPRFKSMYFNNSTHTSLLLKLDLHRSLVYLLSGVRLETWIPLDFPYPFPVDSSYFCVNSSSVNGILCLNYISNRVVLWNPSTREFKIVPPSPLEFESPYRQLDLDYKGFGYDHFRDDYKVIRHADCSRVINGPHNPHNVSFEPFWEIYSVRSHSWKKLDCQIPTMYGCRGTGLYIDGVCHWWGTYGNHVLCLGSFDLGNEVSFTTLMPSYLGDDSFEYHPTRVQLAVINGSVALISNYPEKTTIEVSFLGEVGVKESWFKLFVIGPLPCIVNLFRGVGKNGNILFTNKDGVLAWFDWSNHMIVDLGLKVSPFCQLVTYRENFESLVSIGFEK